MKSETENLLNQHIGLVHSLAKKYQHNTIPYEDLVQEGMIGLWEAQKKYTKDRETKFSTYAYFWIKKRILAAVDMEKSTSMNSIKLTEETTRAVPIQNKSDQIVLPDSIPEIEKRLLKLHFEKEYTLKELAAELGLPRERVRQLREKALRRMRILKGKNKNTFTIKSPL